MLTAISKSEPIEQMLSRLDVELVGVASVEDASGTPLYDSARGMLPSAKSIVVVAVEIFAEMLDIYTRSPRIAGVNARGLFDPHLDFLHDRLNRALYQIASACHQSGFQAVPIPGKGAPADRRALRGVLSFKHAAQFAGLGTIGRSSLLITPQFGPRIRMATVVTDAPLAPASGASEDPCASCPGLCIEHCPVRALAVPGAGEVYAINKFACSAYQQGNRGCASCMAVCPEASSGRIVDRPLS